MSLITGIDPLLTDLDYANLSAANQAKVDAIIEAGSALIEKYCNRIFTAATYSNEKHDGTGHNEIYIDNPPLRSLTSVVIRYGDTADSDETYTTNYFETEWGTGRIVFSQYNITANETLAIPSYFPRGRQNILITYTGGFVAIPEPIQMVLADFVLRVYDNLGEAEIVSEKLGQYFYKTKESVSSRGSNDPYSAVSKYHMFLKLYKLRKA